MDSIVKRINARLANEGKPQQKSSNRKGSDIDKIKQPVEKVPQFKDKPVGPNKRVANNAFRPPRMNPAKADMMRFRQESDQAVGPKPFNPDKQGGPHKQLNPDKFVRVANNVFRNEESVLDQAERMIFNRNIKRELSQELKGLNQNEHKKIAELVKMAHVAEKQAQADADKSFLSKFTGPTETLVEVPELKQQVDENLDILKRAQPSPESIKSNKHIQNFVDEFNLKKGFTPSPREQARLQMEQLKPQTEI